MPSQKTCHHVHPTGALCQSPPLRNRDYCHFHLDQIGRQMRAARARARHLPARLKLPLLEDPFAVHVAIMQMGDAIMHNEIDVQRGRLLLSLLRVADSNLKTMRDWEHEPLFVAHEGEEEIVDWPGFEQENELPEGFDLSVDPEVAFPPPPVPVNPAADLSGATVPDSALRARIRRALGDAETAIPGTDYHLSADDMELIEAYERGGEAAGLKCADKIDREQRRRQRRLERAHYEELARNRNIQLAAEKLVRDQQRAAQQAAAQAQPPRPQTELETQYKEIDQRAAEAETKRKKPQSETPVGELKACAAEA